MALAAIELVQSSTVPKRMTVGHEIKPIWPHPFVAWIDRLLGRPKMPVCYVPGPEITGPCVFMIGDAMFVHPENFSAFAKLPEFRAPVLGPTSEGVHPQFQRYFTGEFKTHRTIPRTHDYLRGRDEFGPII